MKNPADKTRIIVLAAYVAILFCSIPFIWHLEVFLRANTMLMKTVGLVVALYIVVLTWKGLAYAGVRALNIALIGLFNAGYLWMIVNSKGFDKKLHYVEYGILTWLAFVAFRERFGNARSFLYSMLLVIVVGCLDEMVQYFVPGRSFDPGDMLSNVIAGACMIAFLFLVRALRKRSAAA